MSRAWYLLVVALSACGSESGGGAAGAAGASGTGGAGGAAGASSHRTLSTCDTSIAADAPELYKRYFRCVTITTTADAVTIATEDLPPHLTNYYGVGNADYAPFDTGRGAQYHANPNTLAAKSLAVTIPGSPTAKGLTVVASMVDGIVHSSTEEYPMGPAGVALDSVALFNPLAAPGDNIENEKYTFDDYDAHPAPDGTYHYHSASPGPLEVLVDKGTDTTTTLGAAEVELFGVMCDGTIVMGCTELDGGAVGSPALDAQGGHVHDVTDKDGTLLEAARYHVHVCPSSPTGRRFTPEIQYYTTCQL